MKYIYDILLNLSKDNLFEFYEWKTNDYIMHIKKIPIIRVDDKTLFDVVNKNIKIKEEFLLRFENLFETYTKENYKKYKALVLFSNCKKTIAVNFNSKKISSEKSSLLIDEEIEANEFAKEISLTKLKYEVLNMNDKSLLTREEKEKNKFLIVEIEKMKRKKEFEKLKYFYFEFANEKLENIDLIYEKFKKNLQTKWSINHENLYKVIKLSCIKK